MKKVLKPIVFYIAFFVVNFINITLVTTGFKHPNISAFTKDASDWFFSLIGDGGILLFFFSYHGLYLNPRKRINFLTILTVIFTILTLGIACFANVFSLGFSFVQLDSFQNPTQMQFVMYYASYVLNLIITPSNLFLYSFRNLYYYPSINRYKSLSTFFNLS